MLVSNSKKSKVFSQINAEKWISTAEINSLKTKESGFWKLEQVNKEKK